MNRLSRIAVTAGLGLSMALGAMPAIAIAQQVDASTAVAFSTDAATAETDGILVTLDAATGAGVLSAGEE